MKSKRVFVLLFVLIPVLLLARYLIVRHNENKPVNCSSTIIFKGSSSFGSVRDSHLYIYNPRLGTYSRITGMDPKLEARIKSKDVRDIFSYSGKRWITYLHQEGDDSYENLASFDGKLQLSNVPACRFLGMYKGKLWLSGGDTFYSVSLPDGKIKPLTIPLLDDVRLDKANLSKGGIFAASKGISDATNGHLVLISLDEAKIIKEYPGIKCFNASISPSGTRVAVNTPTGPTRIYDIRGQEPVLIGKFNYGLSDVLSIQWTSDEKYLVFCVMRTVLLPLLAAGVGQLGIVDVSDGRITWLSATTAPTKLWCTSSYE